MLTLRLWKQLGVSDTDFKMSKKAPFPWHYYIRAARSRAMFALAAAFISIIVCKNFPEDILLLETSAIVLLVFWILIYCSFKMSPIRNILKRVEVIQERLPHDKKLDLIYRKNEFELINEVLTLIESQLKEQKLIYENQLKQANTLLESIPNSVVIVDKFQNCKQFNKRFEHSFIKDKSVSGVKEIKLWKVFDNKELLEAFEKSIDHGATINIPAMFFEKLQIYFDIAVTPVKDSAGEITGVLGIFHDVTRAKLSEKMRVDFVANVSHEIRTPLTSIKGYSQLLKANKEQVAETLVPVLDKIDNNSDRLKDLFDNLLKLSVIESQGDIEKELFNISSLVTNVSSNLRGKYFNKKFEVNSLKDFKVWGDPKLLEQVFTNLMDNAIKYSDKETTTIDLEVDESDSSYIINVSDNGPGISLEEQNRIFERFYRIQGKSEKAIEGSGLGLSIVKHIIQKHNGSIKASSSDGKGSTFTIELPKIS